MFNQEPQIIEITGSDSLSIAKSLLEQAIARITDVIAEVDGMDEAELVACNNKMAELNDTASEVESAVCELEDTLMPYFEDDSFDFEEVA